MKTITEIEAIQARHSVRSYTDTPIPEDVRTLLEEKIAEVNLQGKLHIQLVTEEPLAFSSRLAKYGRFRGVRNYLALVGVKASDLEERVGYWGEHLVIYAQQLGLNTCWVGLTFKKVPQAFTVNDGEKLVCVIAIGYGTTQGVSHKVKDIHSVSNCTDQSPAWFRHGVEAALLAPTAVNQQKFLITLAPDGTVSFQKKFSLVGYTSIDLGIVKYHFEVGKDA